VFYVIIYAIKHKNPTKSPLFQYFCLLHKLSNLSIFTSKRGSKRDFCQIYRFLMKKRELSIFIQNYRFLSIFIDFYRFLSKLSILSILTPETRFWTLRNPIFGPPKPDSNSENDFFGHQRRIISFSKTGVKNAHINFGVFQTPAADN
jgi:hypothetical protein